MIEGHRILQLRTTKGEKVEAEVNYSTNEKVAGGKVVRFKLGGKEYDIPRSELTTLLLVIGDEATQKKLMPLKTSTVRKVERLLTFRWRATRPYNKGEEIEIRAPWIDTQVTEDEILSGAFLKRKAIRYDK